MVENTGFKQDNITINSCQFKFGKSYQRQEREEEQEKQKIFGIEQKNSYQYNISPAYWFVVVINMDTT